MNASVPPGPLPSAPGLPHLWAGFRTIGQLRPRTAQEILAAAGPTGWSVGCETLDRDYVDFRETSPHLGELGATGTRMQAGWAKCEPRPGHYDWRWLDEAIDGALAQGVRPWLQTSYGNCGYEGGGGIGLSEGLPVSASALQAWERWVGALAERYAGRVNTWEIWNEPENRGINPPEAYAAFFVRTAEVLRRVQPGARIVGLSLGAHDRQNYAGRFLETLAAAERVHLLDEISFHFYPHNPDDSFDVVEDLARVCARYAPRVTLRQGETGAPSTSSRFLALGEYDWNEHKQAVWTLRRLLAHHARGFPMNLFQLADMYYERRGGALFEGHNSKGLLAVRPDKSVDHRKLAYACAQRVFTVWDGRFPLQPTEPLTVRAEVPCTAYAWRMRDAVEPAVIAWWRSDGPPGQTAAAPIPVGLPAVRLRRPVLIDFLSGRVAELPEGLLSGNAAGLPELPACEWPLALAERDQVPMVLSA